MFYLDEQAVWIVPRVHGRPGGPAALRLQPPEGQPLRRGEQLPQPDAHVRVPHAGKHSYSRGAGLEKTRVFFFLKTQPSGFFCFFFWFFWFFLPRREGF